MFVVKETLKRPEVRRRLLGLSPSKPITSTSRVNPTPYSPQNVPVSAPFNDTVAPIFDEPERTMNAPVPSFFFDEPKPQKQNVATSLSFSTPFADFFAVQPYEHTLSEQTSEEFHNTTQLSFSSPETDFICAQFPGEPEPILLSPHTNLSFSSPFADFLAPTVAEQEVSVKAKEDMKHLSFSSPFADFCAPTLTEQEMSLSVAREITNMNHIFFASPESDFTGLCAIEPQGEPYSPTLSFASPESDFTFYLEPEPVRKSRRTLDCSIPRTISEALAPSRQARVITEAHPPFRIVHVNHAWEELCGFSNTESVGKTLEILQGPITSKETLHALKVNLITGNEEGISAVLTNYRKDGSSFLNHIHFVQLSASVDSDDVTHLLGVLEDISPTMDASYA